MTRRDEQDRDDSGRPLVELLYFAGCPSQERLLPRLRQLAGDAGAELTLRRVETADEAEAERFLGSPTVRVDGTDVEPGAPGRVDYGIKCRIFRFDGGQSPTPPEEWIRAALARANGPRDMTRSRTPLEAVIGADRWAANRLAGLGADERRLYAFILRELAQGRPLSPEELERSGRALGTLVERDLIGLGAEKEVTVAYPFSALTTRHRVRLQDGRTYWAMCAIDALGIPHLLHQAAEVEATEPDGDRRVTIHVDPRTTTPRWTPAEALVVAASSGTGCTSLCACPHINVFASKAAAERYLAKPGLYGTILTVPEATTAGRRLFGDLLERLDETDSASAHPPVNGRTSTA